MKNVTYRRTSAIDRLTDQLTAGTKTVKGTTQEKVDLTSKNKQRIKDEIKILKSKINLS